MPTFDNQESLSSIRTKINDAITMTEGHGSNITSLANNLATVEDDIATLDQNVQTAFGSTAQALADIDAAKQGVAPDDGNQYVGKNGGWEVFTPPTDPVTFETMVANDPLTTSHQYPHLRELEILHDPGMPKYWSVTSPAPWLIEQDGVRVLTSQLCTTSHSAKYRIYKQDNRWQLTLSAIVYLNGSAATATTSLGFSGAGQTFNIQFLTAGTVGGYLSVAIGTSAAYATTDKVPYTSLTGWHQIWVTFERDAADTKWVAELWFDDVSKSVSDYVAPNNEVCSSASPINSGYRVTGDPSVKVAAVTSWTTKKTVAEMQALFDQFKADHSIV